MIPQLTASIPPQNFEVIRRQLCEILTAEFGRQHTLNNAYPHITKVWEERFIIFNSETEVPAINVNMARGDYSSGRTAAKDEGDYIYNIDVYTQSPTTDSNGPGDQYAMMLMHKIIGMVRAIIVNPAYFRLALTPVITIGYPQIKAFWVADKSTVQDALSDVIGRVQLHVKAIETTELSTGVLLAGNDSHVTLNESEEGFYYTYTP